MRTARTGSAPWGSRLFWTYMAFTLGALVLTLADPILVGNLVREFTGWVIAILQNLIRSLPQPVPT